MAESGQQPGFDPSSFPALITGLSAQAKILLGQLENPMTGAKEEVDLDRARMIINTVEMLAEKTRDNLSEDEDKFLNTILVDLRISFVAAAP